MGRWVFVRHGESTANAADLLAGHLDVPLTERGRAQAIALAPRLAGISFHRALSSDLVRAFDTARLALGERGLPVQPVPALRERAMGAWEGASRRALREDGRFGAVLLSWDVRAPGGESNREAALRALAWLEAIDTGPTTLLVAHGGVLRSLIGLLDGRAPRDFLTDEVPNAHPVSRELDPAAWRRARQRAIG
jgi:broad specificity phosphatase PhoE